MGGKTHDCSSSFALESSDVVGPDSSRTAAGREKKVSLQLCSCCAKVSIEMR